MCEGRLMKQLICLVFSAVVLMAGRYEKIEKDGVIIDYSTSLMWQEANITKIQYKIESAISRCETLSLGGYEDWRLPNFNELYSLMDIEKPKHFIDPIFELLDYNETLYEANIYYWSSTTFNINNESASNYRNWSVNFHIGSGHHFLRSNFVRCVRSIKE